jgi:hypothetical protein
MNNIAMKDQTSVFSILLYAAANKLTNIYFNIMLVINHKNVV